MFSDKEIEYIKSQRLARISTMPREGALQLLDIVPVGFDFDTIKKYFYVRGLDFSKTEKYTNVLKNEKVAFLIDDLKSENPWSPRGIRIHGTAEIVAPKGQGYLKDSNHASSTGHIRIVPNEKWSWGIDEYMKKTLIVKYIPRNEQSNTKKLLDTFREEISNSNVEELDLLEDTPDMFLRNNLLAYINRNLLGQKLLPREENLLSKMDRMATQLKSADIVVVVFPMYNYSMPAIVKAWFDSVIQKGITFGERKDGQMNISNTEKKALILVSSGGVYSNEPFSGREHALSLSIQEFQYMGYSDVRGALAEGMSMKDEVKQTNLDKSIHQIRAIAREWYQKERYENSNRVSPISKNRRFDTL
jgi:PPOX class F420-dependent enzyme/OxyR family protein